MFVDEDKKLIIKVPTYQATAKPETAHAKIPVNAQTL
jgi:hypothetical protein